MPSYSKNLMKIKILFGINIILLMSLTTSCSREIQDKETTQAQSESRCLKQQEVSSPVNDVPVQVKTGIVSYCCVKPQRQESPRPTSWCTLVRHCRKQEKTDSLVTEVRSTTEWQQTEDKSRKEFLWE